MVELYREKVVGKEDKVFYKYYYITKDEYGEKRNYLTITFDQANDLNRIFDYLAAK